MAMKSSKGVSGTNGAKLCSQCSVLSFNDKILASYVISDSYISCLDLTAKASRHPRDYKATDYKKGDSILNSPVLRRYHGARKYPLDYKVADSLPGLPYLEQSGLRGCKFCSLLRFEIMRAKYIITGFVEITLAYHLKPTTFSSFGLAFLLASVTQRPGLSSIPPASNKRNVLNMDIIFIVESDGGQSPRTLLRILRMYFTLSLLTNHI